MAADVALTQSQASQLYYLLAKCPRERPSPDVMPTELVHVVVIYDLFKNETFKRRNERRQKGRDRKGKREAGREGGKEGRRE